MRVCCLCFLLGLIPGLGLAKTLELFPARPGRGEFVIVRINPCASDGSYEIRLSGGVSFPVVESLPSGCVGYMAIPLMTASTTVLELRKNGRTVRKKVLVFPAFGTGPARPITVPPDYVKPPDSLSKRIGEEAHLLREIRKNWTNARFFGNMPVMPVEKGRMGTGFGVRRIFNDQRESVHWGVDIAGAPALICSVFPGRVILVRDLYFAGLTVFVQHGMGLMTQYSHLAEAAVKEGDFVAGGAVLGRMGMSGRATGPHLHWSAYVNGTAVDPLTVMSNSRKFRFD